MVKVTVYITNHNYGKFIEKAVESVLCQTFDDYELIILDDGSTDDSREILKKYETTEKIKIIYQPKKGLPTASNNAIKLSRGEYIMRLDGDDWLDENALLVLSKTLDSHPEAGLVYPDYFLVTSTGEMIDYVRHRKMNDEVKLLDFPAHGAGTMIRKSCYDCVEGYDEKISCQDGYDFWIKFIKQFKPYNVNVPLFYYRRHNSNLTSKSRKILKTRRAIKKSFIEREMKDNKLNVLALVPAREYSSFMPDFAVRNIAGKPLIAHTLDEAKKSGIFSKIVVVSESQNVLDAAKQCGVDVLLRDASLAASNMPLEPTVSFALKTLESQGYIPDIVMLLQMSAPLKSADNMLEALNTLLIYETDSVVSVTENAKPHYRPGMFGLEPLFKKRTLKSEREILYEEIGALYASRRNSISESSFVGKKVGHVVLLPEEAIDIDSQFDFFLAEQIMNNREQLEALDS